MSSKLYLSLLGGLLVSQAAALPAPQGLDFDAIFDLPPAPTPIIAVGALSEAVVVNTKAALSSVAAAMATEVTATVDNSDVSDKVKRDVICPTQPAGFGALTSSPDTPSAFLANPAYSSAALSAPIPPGYTQVYSNLNASTSTYYYLGYTSLKTYDTAQCATACGNTKLCQSFNIFFERDPSIDPNDASCYNPPSTTQIKCVFWGGPITAQTATNVGQWRGPQFQVVIAGSNGYVNTNYFQTAPTGYTVPTNLGNYAVNAPLDCNNRDTYMGVRIFNQGPFDVDLCAAACTAQSVNDILIGINQTCQYFVTYELSKNGVPMGQYCMTYNQTWPTTYANNNGQWDAQGNHYTISSSYMSSNATAPGICIPDPPASFYLEVGNSSSYLDLVDPDGEGCYFAASVSQAGASVFTIDSKGHLSDASAVYLAEYTGPDATPDEVFFDTPSLTNSPALYNYGTCSIKWSAANQRQEVSCAVGHDDTFFTCPSSTTGYLVLSYVGSTVAAGCTPVTLVAIAAK